MISIKDNLPIKSGKFKSNYMRQKFIEAMQEKTAREGPLNEEMKRLADLMQRPD